jgi:hypothetical protein
MAHSGIPLLWTGDGGVNKFWFLTAVIALASCSKSEPFYCETEERTLPELEWKARALTQIRKEDREFFSNEKHKSLIGKNDKQVTEYMKSYILSNPSCCEIDFEDKYNLIQSNEKIIRNNGIHVEANIYMGVGLAASVNSCGNKIVILDQG